MLTFFKSVVLSTLLIFATSCSDHKDKKPIVIPDKITYLFVTQPSCPSCDVLEKSMEKASTKELLERYFEVKKVFLGEQLPATVTEPNGTPTVYFLGANDEVLVEPIIGEKDEDELMEYLKDALLEFNTTYHRDLIKLYNDKNNSTTTE